MLCSYVRSVVNATECLAEVSDSDGDIITYQGTVFAIFEFISSLIESTKLQKILVPILPELMYYIVAHLQITEEQVCFNWGRGSRCALIGGGGAGVL